MTQTCKTCYDYYCDKAGQDLRGCEHYVRLSDVDKGLAVVEPLPVVDDASSITCPFFDQCSEIVTRLRKLERALCDIGRAVDGELL